MVLMSTKGTSLARPYWMRHQGTDKIRKLLHSAYVDAQERVLDPVDYHIAYGHWAVRLAVRGQEVVRLLLLDHGAM